MLHSAEAKESDFAHFLNDSSHFSKPKAVVKIELLQIQYLISIPCSGTGQC